MLTNAIWSVRTPVADRGVLELPPLPEFDERQSVAMRLHPVGRRAYRYDEVRARNLPEIRPSWPEMHAHLERRGHPTNLVGRPARFTTAHSMARKHAHAT